MSDPPVVTKRVIRPGDPVYTALVDAQAAWLKAHGVTLPDPSPALQAEFADRGRQRCVEAARARGWPVKTTNQFGDDFAERYASGEIVAPVLGAHLQIPYRPNDTGGPDAGGDLHVRPDCDLDAKKRQLFLTLNGHEIAELFHKPAIRYLLLVQQRTPTSPYIYCGAITPTRFLELAHQRLELAMNGRVFRFVTACELTTPKDFARELEELRA